MRGRKRCRSIAARTRSRCRRQTRRASTPSARSCNVGCGYKVYVWADGTEGGVAADANGFGVDFTAPQAALSGLPYTESMHSVIRKNDGRDYHVAIVPAGDSPINLLHNHSSRGGSNATTTWSDSRPTAARLHYPLLRVGDTFNAIPWSDAVELQALVIKGVLDKYGSDQLAAKIFDHGGGGGGYENTYGTGRLLFTGLQMKYTGIHNRPAYSSETWGTRDRGMHELNYTAQDARLADTIVLWGANSYETATVFFMAHMVPNLQGATSAEKAKFYGATEPMAAARMIIVDPRLTATVNAARKTGANVLHLRPNLGTDYMLANAIARVVWERKLYDGPFLSQHTDMKSFADYQAKSLQADRSYADVLADAERITGVPQADIEQAATWIAERKKGGFLQRTLILYEKGIIWNYRQYDAVAAVAQLGALTWSVGRPGTGTGRQGGHQEGYARPDYPGPKPPPDVNKYVQSGQGKLFWVIACNPYLSAQNNQLFRKRIGERTQALGQFLSRSASEAGEPGSMAELAARILDGVEKTSGLFLTVEDIYLTETARDAHLVLPAAQWGEAELCSLNCNSRLLRLYDRFMDPPGDARPDWDIHAMVGRRLEALYAAEGKADIAKRFAGMDWKSGEDVLKAAEEDLFNGVNTRVPASEAGGLDPQGFKGVTYAFLREVGQNGIQNAGADGSQDRRAGRHRTSLSDLQVRDAGRQILMVRHAPVGRPQIRRRSGQISHARRREILSVLVQHGAQPDHLADRVSRAPSRREDCHGPLAVYRNEPRRRFGDGNRQRRYGEHLQRGRQRHLHRPRHGCGVQGSPLRDHVPLARNLEQPHLALHRPDEHESVVQGNPRGGTQACRPDRERRRNDEPSPNQRLRLTHRSAEFGRPIPCIRVSATDRRRDRTALARHMSVTGG